jgi:plasmid maintenance system antidote protein VapI
MSLDFVTCYKVPAEFKNFTELLTDALNDGSQQAAAKKIGVSPTQLNRVLSGVAPPFGAWNCLRLARVFGYKPSLVLRLAGRGEWADIIESLYGEVDSTMTPQERAHFNRWRQLDAEMQRRVDAVLELLPVHSPPAPR